jgi:hypothetical protein
MTETIEVVTNGDERMDQQALAEQLLAEAKANNVELIGPGGLLNQLTKRVLESALEAETTEHLGYDQHDPVGRGSGNSRNGVRPNTVLTPDRPGRDRRAPGHRCLVHPGDRAQTATPPGRGEPDRVVTGVQRVDDRETPPAATRTAR